MSRDYVPERGDVVWLTFTPQAGRRSAVILSSAAYNGKAGLALLCPITSQVKGYPFEVMLPAGLAVNGVILADQVKSLDWRVREAEYVATLPGPVVKQVLEKLAALIE